MDYNAPLRADRVDALCSGEVKSLRAPVAQLDRVLVSEAKGHRFDSCRARQFPSQSLTNTASGIINCPKTKVMILNRADKFASVK